MVLLHDYFYIIKMILYKLFCYMLRDLSALKKYRSTLFFINAAKHLIVY